VQCVILVGGMGTRLGQLVKDCPKPMLPINGKPFLDYLLKQVVHFGFKDILLLGGYKSNILDEHYNKRYFLKGININILTEPKPLGTGGALKFAKAYLYPEFLLMNGDSLFDFDLLDFISFSKNRLWYGKMALRHIKNTSRYGIIKLNKNSCLISEIKERSEKSLNTSHTLINGGVYWLKKDVVNFIMPTGFCSLEKDIFPLLIENKLLLGKEYNGFFLDIGIPADYKKAQRILPLKRPLFFLENIESLLISN